MACQLDQPHTHGFCDRLPTVGHLQLAVDVLHFAVYRHFTPELAGGKRLLKVAMNADTHSAKEMAFIGEPCKYHNTCFWTSAVQLLGNIQPIKCAQENIEQYNVWL